MHLATNAGRRDSEVYFNLSYSFIDERIHYGTTHGKRLSFVWTVLSLYSSLEKSHFVTETDRHVLIWLLE